MTESLEARRVVGPEGFDAISYRFDPTYDKFDAEALERYYQETFGSTLTLTKPGEKYEFNVAPRDGEAGPLHLHLKISPQTERIEFTLSYFRGGIPLHESEKEPYAEDILSWLRGFFKYPSAHGHISACFTFPADRRISRFPVMTVDVGTAAEIDGMSFRLSEKPEGVSNVRFLRDSTSWHVDVVAERRVTFAEASVWTDVAAIRSTVALILPEVTP